jgi:hypothetical protein
MLLIHFFLCFALPFPLVQSLLRKLNLPASPSSNFVLCSGIQRAQASLSSFSSFNIMFTVYKSCAHIRY